MSYLPQEDANPFRAPAARIGDYASNPGDFDRDGQAEVIRRDHIRHESSIKTLGALSYLGAFFGLFLTPLFFYIGSGAVPLADVKQPNGEVFTPEALRILFLGLGVFFLVLTIINGFLGYGLRRLMPWARWTEIVLTSLNLLINLGSSLLSIGTNPTQSVFSILLGSLIPGYILYLVASAKGAMVFSPEYKEVIRKTPGMKAGTSLLLKILLGFLIAILLLIVIGVIATVMT